MWEMIFPGVKHAPTNNNLFNCKPDENKAFNIIPYTFVLLYTVCKKSGE